MRCNTCQKEKASYWFDSSSSICFLCEIDQERAQTATRVLERLGFQVEAEPICRTCHKPKHSSLFREEKLGYSLVCKVCEGIANYRQGIENKAKQQAVEERQQLENIPIRGYERNKKERYTIKCTRCKERRNPEVVRVVSAICELCWKPEERDAALEQHNQWNHTFGAKK